MSLHIFHMVHVKKMLHPKTAIYMQNSELQIIQCGYSFCSIHRPSRTETFASWGFDERKLTSFVPVPGSFLCYLLILIEHLADGLVFLSVFQSNYIKHRGGFNGEDRL